MSDFLLRLNSNPLYIYHIFLFIQQWLFRLILILHIYLFTLVILFPWMCAQKWDSWAYGNNILKTGGPLHCFPSSCTNWRPHQQCTRVPFSTSLQTVILFKFYQMWHDISLWFWFAVPWGLVMLSLISWSSCPSLERCLFWASANVFPVSYLILWLSGYKFLMDFGY